MDRRHVTPTGDSMPTVRVTIGRIDVRAILPPAPHARPATSRTVPALSLADYLKQRNEGRR